MDLVKEHWDTENHRGAADGDGIILYTQDEGLYKGLQSPPCTLSSPRNRSRGV